MKQPYAKQFSHLVDEIVTEAFLFPAFAKGTLPPLNYFTQNAAWDTGSEQSIISPELAEALRHHQSRWTHHLFFPDSIQHYH